MNKADLHEIRKLIAYDSKTGDFSFLVKRGKSVVGGVAGSMHNNGYWKIGLFNKKFLAHRLAWAMHYGEWPSRLIDHIDGDKLNNRIGNLRLASKSDNAANSPGFASKRVTINHRNKTKPVSYWAAIEKDGKKRHLGTFPTRALAEEFRTLAAQMLFGEFARS